MALVVVACGARTLNDNFTAETGLNPSQWTTQSDVLRELAALNLSDHRGTVPMPPILNFGEEGMEMSGVVGKNQFVAIASTETFSPPFTLTATVKGVIAHGNAFAIYLATDDVSQWLNIQGNLNPENQPYYGIRMSFTSRGKVYHGAHIYRTPATNKFYTIRVSVGADGRASVQLMDGNSLICSEGGLQVGTGPFHVALGQREGLPRVAGPNVAIWRNVSVLPSLAGISLHIGRHGVLTPAFSDLMPNVRYQLEISSDLQHWTNYGEPFMATNASMVYPAGWDSSGADRLFFRLRPAQ